MAGEIFVSHSLNCHFARRLRQELAARLETLGLEPFVAEADLEAGLPWRPEIFEHLDGCVGGVLLLTPRSVARPWVRFESNILLHRTALHGCPRLLILKIADRGEALNPEDLEWFEPGQLTEIQSRELTLDLPSLEAPATKLEKHHLKTAKLLADEIRRGFAGLQVPEVPPSLTIWYGDVKSLLPDRLELAPRLRAALQALRPDADLTRLQRVEEMREALAHELMVARPRQALAAFGKLRGSPGLDARALFDRIQLSQVSCRTAERVARVCRDQEESRRTIFLACVVLEPAPANSAAIAPAPQPTPRLDPAGYGPLPQWVLRRAYGCEQSVLLLPLTARTGEELEEELETAALQAVQSYAFSTSSEDLRDSPVKYVLAFACPTLPGGAPDLRTGERCAGTLAKLFSSLPRVGLGRRLEAEHQVSGEAAGPWTLLDETLSVEEERKVRVEFAQMNKLLELETGRVAPAAP